VNSGERPVRRFQNFLNVRLRVRVFVGVELFRQFLEITQPVLNFVPIFRNILRINGIPH